MDYKVIVAPRAIDDLRDIVLYIAPDRPEAAKMLGLALIERTKVLGVFPFSGKVVPEFNDRLIRELILRPYRIVHRISENQKVIGIARFWHGARGALEKDDIRE